MALWARSGARSGGICGSPVSSEDESDVFTYDDKENDRANTTTASKKKLSKSATRARKPKPPPKSLKRQRGDADDEKADKSKSKKASKAALTSEPPSRVVSKKELIRRAPLRFVEYLADQLAPSTQEHLCEEIGVGQGYMMRSPMASWGGVSERREYDAWAQQLGFLPSKVHRHLYRISSLNVEIVLAELRTRVHVPPTSTSFVADEHDTAMAIESEAEPEPRHEESTKNISTESAKTMTMVSGKKRGDTVTLQTVKAHFQQLDQEELETLSIAEHNRLLSTIRHEQIADAMEEVLARPSVRKARDRARRMSKLGRIAERRLSVIPMRQSILPSTIMEGAEWEDDDDDELEPVLEEEEEEEEEQLQYGNLEEGNLDEETKSGDIDALQAVEQLVITPMKSPRRSSVGQVMVTPSRASINAAFTTPRRSTISKSVVIATPTRTPIGKAVASTPRLQTPLSKAMATTPRRTPLSKAGTLTTPRRSPAAKSALVELKKWRIIGRNALGALFRSGFLTVSDLKTAFDVSKIWREISLPAYAWSVADYTKQPSILSMDQVYANCPRGHYLSDGAYKEVFKVFSTRHKRLEAVSVMDIRAIESTGNQHIVRQEVAHSSLLSELVRSKFSPHFVEIYDVFLAEARPHAARWGNAAHRKPVDLLTGGRKSLLPALVAEDKSEDSLYQYIHMEFCDGGDVEDFIGLQDKKLLPVASVVLPFFFQMVFSLYSARERFQMRHCDIKLLNFFLKDISRKELKCASDEPLTLHYAIGNDAFRVQMPATFSYWVKLADYGTADSNVDNLGKPVTLDQFTTLENTPVEFLLDGDHAQQSFAADTFSLGLCLLHLFTGSAPYEEILESVKCPALLLLDLKRLWLSTKKASPFSVLRRVAQDDSDDVLMHTLYRYIVLFGLPLENPSAQMQTDRVWALLIKHLRPGDAEHGGRQPSRRAAVSSKPQPPSATDQFQKDRAKFNIVCGSNPIIKRARDRMARVPGAQELLKRLVAFDPTTRPTMKETLFHEIFTTLRVAPVAADDDLPARVAHYTIDCYSAGKIPADRLPDV